MIYARQSGSVGLDLKNYEKPFKIHWIDIGKGQIVLESEINGGNIISITAPYDVKYGWACTIIK